MDRVYYKCSACGAAYLVTGSLKELKGLHVALSLLQRGCTTDECTGRMEKVSPIPFLRKLTAAEFLGGMAGLGLPHEIDASPEVVSAMLATCEITNVRIQRSRDPGRSVLTALELSNGTILHLAAGPEGAIIYKITRITDGRYNLELQTDTEDGSVPSPGDDLRGCESTGESGRQADGGNTGEALCSNAPEPSLPSGVQEAKT